MDSRRVRLILTCLAIGSAAHSAWAQRSEALRLDGDWEFRFAPDDRGMTEGWADSGHKFDRSIWVPGCWDAQGIGEPTDKLRHNAIGVGWYRRTFTVPDAQRGRRAWLVIGGVHRSARVWVNGKPQGEHIGYPVAFRFDITGALTREREQTLVLAVDSRHDARRDPLVGTFDVIDFMDIHWGGIFEHVDVEFTGDAWLDDVFVRPDPQNRRVEVDVAIRSKGGLPAGLEIDYAVRPADPGTGTHLANGRRKLEAGTVSCAIQLPPGTRLWTPEEPALLVLQMTLLKDGERCDETVVRFGLRRLEARANDFFLNGDRYFLRGYGDDFNFPLELVPPADIAWWTQYLSRRKEFGFNAVRHHSMMPTESYLAAADEVGMFVQPELPIAYAQFFEAASPEARQVYLKVLSAYVRQMRNHPSVMAWCMGNEEWQGFAMGRELYDLARQLDPTRLVIDTDGVWPGADRPTLDYLAVQFDEHSIPWGPTRNKYQLKSPPKPVIVHEMSNLSVLPEPAEVPRYQGPIKPFWLEQMAEAVRRQRLEAQLPAMRQASARLQASLLKRTIEAARLSPEIDGYHQWLFRDYWTQSTGLVNQFDETRGAGPEFVRQFNAPAVVLWDRERAGYRVGEPIAVRVYVADFRPGSLPALGPVRLSLGEQQIPLQAPETVPARGLIGPWTGQIAAPAVAEPRKLLVRAQAGPAANEWPVWVFPSPDGTTTKGPLVAPRLSGSVLQRVHSGETALLTDDALAFPTLRGRFKTAWWKGDDAGDHSYGNLFADHPALRGFPHDGYGDLQVAGLLEQRPVVLLDEVPGGIEPIIWSLDVPWRMRRKAYLFEARVGSGRLLFSTLNLSRKRRADDPAAEWMYHLLKRYAASPECRPRAELPIEWLRSRVAAHELPDLGHCMEGFAAVVGSTEPAAPWYSLYENDTPLHPVRHTDGKQRLRWRTAAVPADWSQAQVTLVWAGGIGYRSQPDAGPFSLMLADKPLLQFPFTGESATWTSPDGAATLRYLVRRTMPEDTFGLFVLTLRAPHFRAGQPLELAVTAPGQGSRRWFGLTPCTNVLARERGEGE